MPSNSNTCKIAFTLLSAGIYQDSPLSPVHIPLIAFSLGVLLILSSSVLLYFPLNPLLRSFVSLLFIAVSFPSERYGETQKSLRLKMTTGSDSRKMAHETTVGASSFQTQPSSLHSELLCIPPSL